MSVRRASFTDLDALVPLFDAYRRFYEQPSDPSGARAFLAARFDKRQSIVFLAEVDSRAVGFTQLFPAFSSVRMAPILILNDLYVAGEARRSGVGMALLEAARTYGLSIGAARLTLSTTHDNAGAQAFYRSAGWIADGQFATFNLVL